MTDDRAADYVERVLRGYLDAPRDGERFAAYVARAEERGCCEAASERCSGASGSCPVLLPVLRRRGPAPDGETPAAGACRACLRAFTVRLIATGGDRHDDRRGRRRQPAAAADAASTARRPGRAGARRCCAGPATTFGDGFAVTSSMADGRARAPGHPGAPRRRRGLPRHRLPLRRDHRHPRRDRERAAVTLVNVHARADRRRAGRRVRAAAARPRPRPVLRAAQGRSRWRGRSRRYARLGLRACAATSRPPAPPRRVVDWDASAAWSRSTRSPPGPRTTSTPTSTSTAAGQPAARARLRLDRLRAVHPPRRPGRGPPRRPLGRARQDRVRAARMSATSVASTGLPTTQLDLLESEAIHILREVAGEFERPVLLFSGGKDSIVLSTSPSRRSGRGARRSPCCTSTPGTTSPRSSPSATGGSPTAGLRLRRRHRAGVDRRRPRRRASRRQPQPAADGHAARRHRRAPVRRRLRRRAPRRGEGPRQGAGVQPARRVRPVGPAPATARAVGPLQRPAPAGRARPGVPALELDRAGRLAVHRPRAHRRSRRSTSRTSGGCSARDGMLAGRLPAPAPPCGRGASRCARSATAPSAT